MALIEPNSRIEFLTGIPFDPSYENTMYFDDLTAQNTYFGTKFLVGVENSSYLRVTSGYIKVGWVVDTYGQSVINQLYNANYMRFKNTNFENKWFYAFVDNVEYINNNTVGVYYHLDVLQTWHFDYSFNQCFIERQHTPRDVIGGNTIPENFELGDYMISDPTEVPYNPGLVIVATADANGDYAPGRVLSGYSSMGDIFTGCQYFTYDLSSAADVAAANSFLENAYTNRNRLNSIIAVYIQPLPIVSQSSGLTNTQHLHKSGNNYVLGNYVVRNKKLMTYPYNFIYVTNYQGNHIELKYEYFQDADNCQVKAWWGTGPNCAMVLFPINYKGITGENFDEMLQLNGFPMCAWMNDAFKAWVAQNASTLYYGASVALASFLPGVKTGVEYGNLENIISDPLNIPTNTNRNLTGLEGAHYASVLNAAAACGALVARVADHYVVPPQAHGNINGNTQYQLGKMNFMICNKHIRQEFAEIIDEYFDMYGYAIHRRGIPNRNARPCYTYVKTVGCSVDGNVPVNDLRLIEEIFNKGVRFWRTNATFGIYNYSVNDNTPVSS